MPRFDTPLTTNDLSIERVLKAGMPVALVIWSHTLDASLDEAMRQVAQTDAGRLLVAKLNANENPSTASRATGPLPALILYRDGQEIGQAHRITALSFRDQVNYLLGRGERPPAEAPKPKPEAAAHPVTITDATFQRDVLDSDIPVLVDLWAAWCGPCRMIAPILEKMAGEYSGHIKIAKLNVDENPRIPGMFQVQGIPTLLFFHNGKLVDRIVGAAPEPMLRSRVDAMLAKV
jgi:thioredoxin